MKNIDSATNTRVLHQSSLYGTFEYFILNGKKKRYGVENRRCRDDLPIVSDQKRQCFSLPKSGNKRIGAV